MKKYLAIVKNKLQEMFAYRYDIAMYTPGNFLELFFSYLLWTVIFQTADVVRGYNYNEMVTYIIVGWIFMFITANYDFEETVSKDIRLGRLTNYLVKPMIYLKYVTMVAIGRVIIAFGFVILQSALYVALFGKNMIVDLDAPKILILLAMVFLAFFIKLFFAIIIGMISFWTMEVVGLKDFLNTLARFFSGAYFPLVMLPAVFVKTSIALPFAYTFFVPVQFYLNKISYAEAVRGVGIQIIWIILLYFVAKIIYGFGLKKYEGFGA